MTICEPHIVSRAAAIKRRPVRRDIADVADSFLRSLVEGERRRRRWWRRRRRATGFYIGGNGGYEWTDYAQDTRPVQHRGRVALPDVPALTENVEGPGDEQAGGNLLREALSPPPDPKMIRSRARTGTAEVPLFPMSHLPVFSLLFAFGEII